MLRRLALIVLCLATLQGCANPNPYGRIISLESDPATGEIIEALYSEYFQAEERIADQRVRAHLIITLGDERLPDEFTINQPVNRFLDEVEKVIELYLTNESDERVVLHNLRLGGLALGPDEIVIEPGASRATQPLVRWSSVFRAARRQTLTYEFNGETLEAEMAEERTWVDQL